MRLYDPDLSRVLVVGESNPYGADPAMALYPLPLRASGDRLRRIMGLEMLDYIALARINLCVGKWSIRAARAEIARVWTPRKHDAVVMLGRKVALACGATLQPFEHDGYLLALPHPSGLNRAWNDPTATKRAREALRSVAPWVAWGDPDERVVFEGPG